VTRGAHFRGPKPSGRRALETEYERLANLLTDREAAHMHHVLAAYHELRARLATQESSTSITKTLPSV
jgi:hypothetical protein